jgi:DNA-binding transcriptional LysR family regulator
MELRQLRQFIALAETQSFRRASEQLFMAQPPLSVAIKKLEDEIGARLFDRGPKGVRLTAAGEAALDAAKRCVKDAERVGSAALAATMGEAGELHVAFISSVTFGLLPRVMQAFRQRYPNVKLTLHEANNRDAFAAMQRGDIDLSFVRLPAIAPEGIATQTVEEDHFCVALPAEHPLTRKRLIQPSDLAGEPLIGYLASQRGGGLHAAVMHLLSVHGMSPVFTQEAVQVHTVIGLVEGGLGVALVPSVHARYASGRVAFRRLKHNAKQHTIGIAVAYPTGTESPVSLRFREVLRTIEPNPD